MTVMYGGAPLPWTPDPFDPTTQQPAPYVRPMISPDPAAGVRVRVCVLVEDDGTVKVKLLGPGDRLIAEVSGTRSITIESEVMP